MKTIEEIANELYPLRSIGGAAEFQQSAFIKGYEFCQKEYEEIIRWIPVEEELPQDGEIVLVKYDGCGTTGEYTTAMLYEGKFYIMGIVTHWRKIELT